MLTYKTKRFTGRKELTAFVVSPFSLDDPVKKFFLVPAKFFNYANFHYGLRLVFPGQTKFVRYPGPFLTALSDYQLASLNPMPVVFVNAKQREIPGLLEIRYENWHYSLIARKYKHSQTYGYYKNWRKIK